MLACCTIAVACNGKDKAGGEALGSNYELVPPLTMNVTEMRFDAPGKVAVKFYLYDKEFRQGVEDGDYELRLFRGDDKTPWCTGAGKVTRARGKDAAAKVVVPVSCQVPHGQFTLVGTLVYTVAGVRYEQQHAFGPGEYHAAQTGDPLADIKQKLAAQYDGMLVVRTRLPEPGSPAQKCDDAALASLTDAERKPWAFDPQLLDARPAIGDPWIWLDSLVFVQAWTYKKMNSAFWDEATKALSTPPALVAVYHVPDRRTPSAQTIEGGKFTRDPGAFNGSLVIIDWRTPDKKVLCHAPLALDPFEKLSFEVDRRWPRSELDAKLLGVMKEEIRRGVRRSLAQITNVIALPDAPSLTQ